VAASTKDLADQTENLRLEFLECVLETTRVFIELTEFEVNVENSPHSRRGIEHIEQGLGNVRRLAERVFSSSDKARISKELARLEQRAAELNQRLDARQL